MAGKKTSDQNTSGTGGTDQFTKGKKRAGLPQELSLGPKEEDTRLKSHIQNNKPKQEKVLDPHEVDRNARNKTGII